MGSTSTVRSASLAQRIKKFLPPTSKKIFLGIQWQPLRIALYSMIVLVVFFFYHLLHNHCSLPIRVLHRLIGTIINVVIIKDLGIPAKPSQSDFSSSVLKSSKSEIGEVCSHVQTGLRTTRSRWFLGSGRKVARTSLFSMYPPGDLHR